MRRLTWLRPGSLDRRRREDEGSRREIERGFEQLGMGIGLRGKDGVGRERERDRGKEEVERGRWLLAAVRERGNEQSRGVGFSRA